MLWLIVWQVPFLLLLVFGQGQVAEIFAFFSRLAVVTFGGAYAVLSYVADVAVGHYGWLKPGEMLDGLALAGVYVLHPVRQNARAALAAQQPVFLLGEGTVGGYVAVMLRVSKARKRILADALRAGKRDFRSV